MQSTPATPHIPYTGPPPYGLTTPEDLFFWNSFVALDNTIENPPSLDDFLFYSGGSAMGEQIHIPKNYIATFYGRTAFPWPEFYPLAVTEPSHTSPSPFCRMRALFDDYLADKKGPNPAPGVPNLHIKCLSWGFARRAALRGGDVHLALWKGQPFVTLDSYWGSYEVGILTCPGSKVDLIIRYDVERLEGGNIAVYKGEITWDREVDEVLGVPFYEQDWRVDPSGRYPDPEPMPDPASEPGPAPVEG